MRDIDYEIKRTVLNDLEEETGRVKLKLKSGEEVTGRTDIIVWEDVDPEDDESMDEYETLRFIPDGTDKARYFLEEEIESYQVL